MKKFILIALLFSCAFLTPCYGNCPELGQKKSAAISNFSNRSHELPKIESIATQNSISIKKESLSTPKGEERYYSWRSANTDLRTFRVNESMYKNELSSYHMVGRGLFAVTLNYFQRKIIDKMKPLWDLTFRFNKVKEIAMGFDAFIITGKVKAPAAEVMSPTFADSPLYPKGAGHIVARLVTQFMQVAKDIKDVVYKDVYANAAVFYGVKNLEYGEITIQLPQPQNSNGTPRTALIGRLLVDKSLPNKAKLFYYQTILVEMKRLGIKEIIIEVTDRSHELLYRRMLGFSEWKVVSTPEYGGNNIKLMRASLDMVAERLGF